MGLERIVGSNETEAVDITTLLANLDTLEHITRHIPKYGGENWYVSKNGLDTNSGEQPDDSFLTIGAALAVVAAGDSITVRAGAYAENIDLNLDSLELYGEIGAAVQRLTVSGDSCYVTNIFVSPTATVGVAITGSYCHMEHILVVGTATIAFDIDGLTAHLQDCRTHSYTVTAFDLNSDACILEDCFAVNVGALTRGFYLSNASADGNLLRNCVSTGNATAGFEVTTGAVYNVFADCVSGTDDGARVDNNGDGNFWPNFVCCTERDSHEDTYPYFGGEGAVALPVTINNTVTDNSGAGPWDDKDYWGDVVRVIAPNMLIAPWYSLGIYIYAVTAADIQPWQIHFANPNYMATRNAGNAWDYQETVLTVSDGTIFEVSDKVWITGTGHLAGEICNVTDVTGNVVTITSETRISADTGLKYNYTGAEQMFVIRRSFTPLLDGYYGDYSAATTKDFLRISWNERKLLPANTGMIMRMANSTDDAVSSFEVRVIYED